MKKRKTATASRLWKDGYSWVDFNDIKFGKKCKTKLDELDEVVDQVVKELRKSEDWLC